MWSCLSGGWLGWDQLGCIAYRVRHCVGKVLNFDGGIVCFIVCCWGVSYGLVIRW